MKDTKQIVQEAVESGRKDYIQEAVNRLLGEDIDFNTGEVIAVGSDPTFPFDGQKGKVRGPSAKGSGYLDVEFANGVVVPLQASLLLKA